MKRHTANVFSDLVNILGRDNAIRLLLKLGGQTIYLPKLGGYQESFGLIAQIRDLWSKTNQIDYIASQMGLDRLTVIDLLENEMTVNA